MPKPDPGMETCPDCCGHGHRAGGAPPGPIPDYNCPPQVLCETCEGSGQVRDRMEELEEERDAAEAETRRQINNMGREVRKVCDGVEALGLRFLSGENVFDGVLRLLKAATENKE